MDDLAELAMARPSTRWAGRPLVLRAETGSTNDDAREAAQRGAPAGYAVVADTQTAGRGRRGRAWHSPAGDNLYVSLVARPALPAHDAPRVTLAAALAVCDAVDAVVGDAARVSVKWPNDVRIDRRKVAGILVEGSLRGASLAFVVVGIGLNVRGDALPEWIAQSATTLRMATGREVERAGVLRALFIGLEKRIDALEAEGGWRATLDEVSGRCDTLGTRVRVDGVEGVAQRIADDGALVVRCDDGTDAAVHAGEVVAAD